MLQHLKYLKQDLAAHMSKPWDSRRPPGHVLSRLQNLSLRLLLGNKHQDCEAGLRLWSSAWWRSETWPALAGSPGISFGSSQTGIGVSQRRTLKESQLTDAGSNRGSLGGQGQWLPPERSVPASCHVFGKATSRTPSWLHPWKPAHRRQVCPGQAKWNMWEHSLTVGLEKDRGVWWHWLPALLWNSSPWNRSMTTEQLCPRHWWCQRQGNILASRLG